MFVQLEEEDLSYPPWNFSWIVKDRLAAMAWPQTIENLNYIVNQGVNHLITLSPERRPPASYCPALKWTYMPIEEFKAPSLKQIKHFIEICELALLQDEVIGIHCRMGKGRTGVMAACYLVYFYDLAPEKAIRNIRLLRPCSIKTYEQEKAVMEFQDLLGWTKLHKLV